jgi:hypothetical protein
LAIRKQNHLNSFISRGLIKEDEDRKKLFRAAYNMANLLEPISHWTSHLLELSLSNAFGPDPQVNCDGKFLMKHRSRFMGELYQSYISSFFYNQLKNDILLSPFYGILFDESTDIGVKQHMIVYIRYLAPSTPTVMQKSSTARPFAGYEPKTAFLGLLGCKGGADADGLFNLLYHFLFTVVGLEKSKLVSVCSDGASVLTGNKQGVITKIKQAISPYIISTHCIAHRLQLATKLSDTSVSEQKWFVSIIHVLFTHFSKSVLRSNLLAQIQTDIGAKILKLIEPSATRWLALSEAVNRVILNLEVLMLYTTTSVDKRPAAQRSVETALARASQVVLKRKEAIELQNKAMADAANSLFQFASHQVQDHQSTSSSVHMVVDSSSYDSDSDSDSSSESDSSDSSSDDSDSGAPVAASKAKSSRAHAPNLDAGLSVKERKKQKDNRKQALSRAETDDIIYTDRNSSSESSLFARLHLQIHSFRFVMWAFSFGPIISILHDLSLLFQREDILSTDLAPMLQKVYTQIAFKCHLDVATLKTLGSLGPEAAAEFCASWKLNFSNCSDVVKKFWDEANQISEREPFSLSFSFSGFQAGSKQAPSAHDIYFLRSASDDLALFNTGFKNFIYQCMKNLTAYFPNTESLMNLSNAFSMFCIHDRYDQITRAAQNAKDGSIDAMNIYWNLSIVELKFLYDHYSTTSPITPILSVDQVTFRERTSGEKADSLPLLSCTFDELLTEWRMVIDFISSLQLPPDAETALKMQNFWCSSLGLFQRSPIRDSVPNVLKLVQVFFCVLLSNAPCERGFSILNAIKTALRSRLSNQCIDKLMRIKLTSSVLKITMLNLDYAALLQEMKLGEQQSPPHNSVINFLKEFN